MSLVNQNIIGGSAAQTGYIIEESLRFNASQSSYLSRTPATSTNTQTWTLSFWVKRGLLSSSASYNFVQTAVVGGAATQYMFDADNLRIYYYNGSSYVYQLVSTQVFRDPSAWYHIVCAVDTTQATSSNRVKLYVNGVQITSFSTATYPSLNATTDWNTNKLTYIGAPTYFDGYLTEFHSIDGQALDPSSFGEFDSVTGVWKPSEYTGTYGTNGFYLPMKLDNTVEGFNTVTYLGNGSTQRISGVGFQPDLVWAKRRSAAASHGLVDAVRGAGRTLFSNLTDVEDVGDSNLISFDADGFTAGSGGNFNTSGQTYVAWCWDAGSSTVSNTDGSITSSVRANPTYGFSVMTYTGNGTDGATIGHGLGATPAMIITKKRNSAAIWYTWHQQLSGANYGIGLNTTDAEATFSYGTWGTKNSTIITATQGANGLNNVNASSDTYVAYCFSEVAGYSKFGSYTGTGASGNTVTTGFKPAMVILKRSTGVEHWQLFDNTRSVGPEIQKVLYPNLSDSEYTWGSAPIKFTDTGFELLNSDVAMNGGSDTYIYMAFKDTREYAYWLDDSGNNNDWQPNGGLTTNSTVTDTPTPYADGGNYAVLNPLAKGSTAVLSNGNLQTTSNGRASGSSIATIAMPNNSGKYYWEVSPSINVANNDPLMAGIIPVDGSLSVDSRGIGFMTYCTTNAISVIYQNTVSSLFVIPSTLQTTDTFRFAYDSATNKIWLGLNGNWYNSTGGTTGDPASGANATKVVDSTKTWVANGCVDGPSSLNAIFNFGQRPFAYTPPTGFKALHTGNLPDSAIVDGSEYFNAVTYTATEDVASSITGVGFQPDFVWVKTRADATSHALTDAVRGVQKALFSNTTGAEVTSSTYLTSFDSDGFTQGGAGNFARNSLVAWNWKANGAGVSNTDGSITSTVSANPTAGFSIVTYTGTGSNATVGHGLGVTPAMLIVKRRDGGANNWRVYHKNAAASPATGTLYLSLTSAFTVDSTEWNNTAPTSSVFSLGTQNSVNGSGGTFVAYCFADVEGYSKFGSYTGNGSSTDGPFVYLGFRPAFVMIKRTDGTASWSIRDSGRNPSNVASLELRPDSSIAEYTDAGGGVDLVSNGFKLRSTTGGNNVSGGTFIYMAFAESPFKVSLAR